MDRAVGASLGRRHRFTVVRYSLEWAQDDVAWIDAERVFH
jgi:hypothetical protein